MRFVTLALERYGHFDDCTLTFRSGEPDLHVVYGANEAGKTTSMAAVSDLLFGFPGRSPYPRRPSSSPPSRPRVRSMAARGTDSPAGASASTSTSRTAR